jgi:hypothetical protein
LVEWPPGEPLDSLGGVKQQPGGDVCDDGLDTASGNHDPPDRALVFW